MNPPLLYFGSLLIAVWGIAHLFATQGVVDGFGDLSEDNRRIITMEWLVEGVALISTAIFVVTVTMIDPLAPVSSAVYGVAIATLVVLTFISFFTGFKINFLPFKLCPVIFIVSSVLIGWGAWF